MPEITFMLQQAIKGRRNTKPLWWAHVMRSGRRVVTGAGKDPNAAVKDAKRQLSRLRGARK